MARKAICILICILSLSTVALGSGIPQNGYNIANANDCCSKPYCSPCCGFKGYNQINQNLNQNALGAGGFGYAPGGFVWLPQNGINIANANGGNNQINQNNNQNALGMSGYGFGPYGLVWIPQNGINIANANGMGNNINQELNQNGFGY